MGGRGGPSCKYMKFKATKNSSTNLLISLTRLATFLLGFVSHLFSLPASHIGAQRLLVNRIHPWALKMQHRDQIPKWENYPFDEGLIPLCKICQTWKWCKIQQQQQTDFFCICLLSHHPIVKILPKYNQSTYLLLGFTPIPWRDDETFLNR